MLSRIILKQKISRKKAREREKGKRVSDEGSMRSESFVQSPPKFNQFSRHGAYFILHDVNFLEGLYRARAREKESLEVVSLG